MIHVVSCGAVVFREDQGILRYVVIRQTNGRHYGFPKGHMEAGETEVATASREVKEETGLDVTIIPSARAETSYAPRFRVRKRVVYFLARTTSTHVTPQLEEVSDILWLTADDVIRQLTFNNDKEVFKLLVGHLKPGLETT